MKGKDKIKLKAQKVLGRDIAEHLKKKKKKNKEHWQTFPKTQVHKYVKVIHYKILEAAYQVD